MVCASFCRERPCGITILFSQGKTYRLHFDLVTQHKVKMLTGQPTMYRCVFMGILSVLFLIPTPG